jgi:FAD/FMN-containing dehydrogenase
LIGLLASPAVVSAVPVGLVTTTDQLQTADLKLKSSTLPPNMEAFCTAFTNAKARLKTEIVEKEAAVTTYLDTLPEDLGNERNGRDAKLEEARSEADQLRSEEYVRLLARADGDKEQAAVKDYQQQVEDAVEARRDAIDAAIVKFRTGVDGLIAKRKKTMQSARDAFAFAVNAALVKLETDCAQNVATVTIRSDFEASLQRARTKLTGDRQVTESMQGTLKSLADTQKVSVAVATEVFQIELTAAKGELKQAFGDDK